MPAALLHFKDVVGAAETGSGKTLAYALPIVHRLLERRAALGMAVERAGEGGGAAAAAAAAPKGRRHHKKAGGGGGGAAAPQPAPPLRPRQWEHLPALILAPSRELAIQVRIRG